MVWLSIVGLGLLIFFGEFALTEVLRRRVERSVHRRPDETSGRDGDTKRQRRERESQRCGAKAPGSICSVTGYAHAGRLRVRRKPVDPVAPRPDPRLGARLPTGRAACCQG